jgi:hypothetical protein
VDFDDQAVAVSFEVKDHPVAGQDVRRGVFCGLGFLMLPVNCGGVRRRERGFGRRMKAAIG